MDLPVSVSSDFIMDAEWRPIVDQYLNGHIPPKFRSATFSLIDRSCSEAVKTCIEGDQGLFLAGPVGTGKTSALYIILKALLFKQISSLAKTEPLTSFRDLFPRIRASLSIYRWFNHFELVRSLRTYYDDYQNLYNIPEFFRTPSIFVDDLGSGYDDKSGWNVALLNEFFGYRDQYRLRIFVTTNKTPSELRVWNGWERIIDRLCDPSWMRTATMTGQSKRNQQWLDKIKSERKEIEA